MISSLKQIITSSLLNKLGWQTNRKIIVFESDDWGSMRMPSTKAYESLVAKDVIDGNDKNQFYKYDSLESTDDLTALFDVLSSRKDFKGNHPVFTAVNVLANPDYDKIRDSNFEYYYYESFMETASKHNKGSILELWKHGAKNNIFVPQFHGREHLNIMAWMRALQNNKKKTRIAFDHQVYGIDSVGMGESKIDYLASFDVEKSSDIQIQEVSIIDGLKLFKKMMGYNATFFVPSNGPFNLKLEKCLSEGRIKYLMLNKFQKEPQGDGKYKYKIRFLGSQNKYNQTYLSRNVSFEPSAVGTDWINYTLNQVDSAFKNQVPAVIGTHRVNYIGSLHPSNRDHGLSMLRTLITELIKLYPDLEFMTSCQLGELISQIN